MRDGVAVPTDSLVEVIRDHLLMISPDVDFGSAHHVDFHGKVNSDTGSLSVATRYYPGKHIVMITISHCGSPGHEGS